MSILTEAEALVHGERQDQYGSPYDQYTRYAGMFNARFAHKLKEAFTAEEMAESMILLKLSRTCEKRDTLIDGAGYFGVVELIQEERKKRGG